ncbi:hypothetical protein Taro_028906, partial [Colocasia esculenta]|nr:hypothetical protein [Colocasia esculenta]
MKLSRGADLVERVHKSQNLKNPTKETQNTNPPPKRPKYDPPVGVQKLQKKPPSGWEITENATLRLGSENYKKCHHLVGKLQKMPPFGWKITENATLRLDPNR